MESVKSAKSLLLVGVVAITLLLSIGYSTISQDVRDLIDTPTEKEAALTQDVRVVKIEPMKVIGLATAGIPSFSENSATFDASLMRSGDTVVYEVTLKNTGKKVAKLQNVSIDEQVDGSQAVKYDFASPSEVLEPGAYTTVKVTATYDDTIVDTPSVTSKIATILYEYSIEE